MTGPGQHRQEEVYVAGMRGRRPRIPVGAARLEEKARERMSPEAFAYVAGGAGLERTMAANLEAFERRRIVPRMLRDVGTRDTAVELFGTALAASGSVRSEPCRSCTGKPTSPSPEPPRPRGF